MDTTTHTRRPNGLRRRFGPTALVTGASDGIGRAFAQELAQAGFDLILVARREAVLHDLARDLTDRQGVSVRVLAQDLALPGSVATLLDATQDERVRLLVVAAGFGSHGRFLDTDLGAELNMIDLNCRAVVDLTHGFGRRMAESGGGGIVLFGSLVGFQGAPLAANYAATKAFVQTFAEGIAAELRPSGIDVLAVAPGPIGSGFAARAGMAMGATGTPETVARGALAALGRRGTVRPGVLSKVLGWSLATLPRALRVRVMGQIMKGMTPEGRRQVRIPHRQQLLRSQHPSTQTEKPTPKL